MKKKNVLVLGVGNLLRRDDGFGPVVIEQLQKNPASGVDYLDGGVDGLALLDIMQPYQNVILIDAVEMNEKPGTVRLFTPQDAVIKIKRDTLSTHGFGLAEVLKLMEQLGMDTPIQIIGVQPQDLSFGEGLSDSVNDRMNEVIQLIGGILSCLIV